MSFGTKLRISFTQPKTRRSPVDEFVEMETNSCFESLMELDEFNVYSIGPIMSLVLPDFNTCNLPMCPSGKDLIDDKVKFWKRKEHKFKKISLIVNYFLNI